MTDLELLKQYDQERSQEAFAELVRRHLQWVHGAANRLVRDRELAEDVTQGVFLALSQRAKSLHREQALSPWLLRVTRCAAISAMRAVSRRQRHEQKAAAMRPESTTRDPEAQWEEVAPLLDEQVLRLAKKDQQAILLRFYERRPLADVGKALGISEEAARMRVQRALEKLRAMLAKNGVTGTTAGLSAVLVGNVVGQMPEHLVERIVSTVGSEGGNSVAAGIAKGAMKMMAVAKVTGARVAALVLVASVVAVAGVVASSGTPTASAPDMAYSARQNPASQPALDQGALIKQLGDSEAQLLNVSMAFDSWQERRTPDAGQWTKTNVTLRGHAWYNGIPNSKARINFDSEVLDWKDGESAMHEASYDAGFDGKTGWLARHSSGSSGQTTPTRRGEIFPKAPSVLQSAWYAFATGIGCSRFYIPDADGRGRPLSKVLQAYAHRGSLEIAREEVDHVSAVRLTLRDVSKVKTTYWLDPSRGYALVRADVDFEGRPAQSYSLHVTKLAELAPGLWFATEGYREYQDQKRPGAMLGTWFRAPDMKVNDTRFDESIFTIIFPEGYRIDDQLAGTSYVSSGSRVRDLAGAQSNSSRAPVDGRHE